MTDRKREEENNKTVLSVPEVAKILGVGKAAAYNLTKQSGFPVVKIGRQLKVPREAFYRWMNNQTAS